MSVKITTRSESTFTLKIEIPYTANILEAEELIQQSLNEAGALATNETLLQHDTDGSPISICGEKLTSKGKISKEFQTPYGSVEVKRHVYQSSQGGQTYVPLDDKCRIINTSTPKFAKMLSSKYACDGAPGVQRDLAENHNRHIALSFIKNTVDAVGAIAEAKETDWSYVIPELPKTVATISIGLDGTCLNMIDDGWREAMCGTIALYDRTGTRMHTIYTAASPEYGKEHFYKQLSMELDRVIIKFPRATIVGLADGAPSNWNFLSSKVHSPLIDFWHATEYLYSASEALFPSKKEATDRELWLESACHRLKHKVGGATRILNELIEGQRSKKKKNDKLKSAITYFSNNRDKMSYYKHVDNNMPIGSGITESACKVLVKQRMCKGAARWKKQGATTVLNLRSLHLTDNRWNQFWQKYVQYGCQEAA